MSTLLERLVRLEEAGLIEPAGVEPEPEYLFRHAMVQEAAYESLLKEERQRLHRAVALALERLYPERREELAAVLGYHFSQAREAEKAHEYLALAGDVALGRYAVLEAAEHYQAALDLAPPDLSDEGWTRLYSRLGRSLELAARYEEALAAYAELETLGRQRESGAMTLTAIVEQARLYSTPNPAFDEQRGRALAATALGLAGRLQDRLAEARIYWILTILNWLSGNLNEAMACGERSLALARQLDRPEQLAYTLQDLYRAYMNVGRVEEAEAVLAEARTLWQRLGNLPMLADNLNSAADLLMRDGRFEEGLVLAGEALSLSRSIDNLWNQAFALGMIGEISIYRGEMGRALAATHEAIALSEEAGLVILNRRAYLRLLDALLLLGEAEEARRTVEQIRRRFEASAEFFRASFRLGLAFCRVRLGVLAGTLDEAEAAIQEVLEIPGVEEEMWSLPRARAWLALARQDYARALAYLDTPLQVARSLHWRYYLPLVLWLRGLALAGLGDLDAAIADLAEALQVAEAISDQHAIWRVTLTWSNLEARRGNCEAAGRLRQQADRAVAFIAAHIPTPSLQAAFRSLLSRSEATAIPLW